MAQPPAGIRVLSQERLFEITWKEGHVDRLGLKFLRCECTCAGCVDEFTGVRLLDPDTIPEDVAVTKMQLAGNYALKITWSDDHDTGLYTWERLEHLGRIVALTDPTLPPSAGEN